MTGRKTIRTETATDAGGLTTGGAEWDYGVGIGVELEWERE